MAGWIAAGFISEETEQYVFNWAMGHRQEKAADLLSLFNACFERGSLGICYEAWLFYMLGKKNSVRLRGKPGLGKEGNTLSVVCRTFMATNLRCSRAFCTNWTVPISNLLRVLR
jgi:hypothetical protein